MESARVDQGYAPLLAAVPIGAAESARQEVYQASGYRAAEPTRWVRPALALVVTIAWVGAAYWLAHDALATMSRPSLVEYTVAVCSVPVLVGLAWQLTGRTSQAEAHRFANTAAGLRAEAATLDHMLARLSDGLDQQREKLGEQARAFATLGEAATERLSRMGSGFSAELAIADRHSAALTGVAQEAQASLGVLIATLPRARAETAELTETLERTGVGATQTVALLTSEISSLDNRIVALAEHAREADALAQSAAARLAAYLADVEQTSEAVRIRLATVTGEMTTSVDSLLDRTARALDGSRLAIDAQGEAMLATVGAHQATLEAAGRDSVEALTERVGSAERIIERVVLRLDTQRAASEEMVGDLGAGIVQVGAQLDALHTQGVERSRLLAASISALSGSATAMTETLRVGDDTARQVIGTAETLLIALDASAREIDETLPDALARLDARVIESRLAVGQAKPELLALVTAAESTHDAIEAIAQVIAGQRGTLDQLSGALLDTLATGRGKADALGTIVDEAIARAHRFADEAAPRLLEALLRVRDTANVAAERARDTLAAVIPDAADKLEAASGAAFARAAGVGVDRQVAAIADAADAAVAAATRASDRLAERLHELSSGTALVEARLVDGRAERDEADRDSFARRVSSLIEQLNSASIDITTSFAPDVSDSAWAAYLKGDRGVFTRRAVRLLDAGQAREVARLYEADASLREQVNRYIHDFEAMLRAVLAQPDGSPLGVTLLSSDMGKLYVALAQAIERLR